MIVALKTGFEWYGSDETVKCRDLCVHIQSDTAKHVGRHAGVSYACHFLHRRLDVVGDKPNACMNLLFRAKAVGMHEPNL